MIGIRQVEVTIGTEQFNACSIECDLCVPKGCGMGWSDLDEGMWRPCEECPGPGDYNLQKTKEIDVFREEKS